MTPYSIQNDDEEINHQEGKENVEEVDTNILIPGTEDENAVTVTKGRKGIFLIIAGDLFSSFLL